MFTGLIEEIGRIERLESSGEGMRLTIGARRVVQRLALGDSIAVDGVCLTVVTLAGDWFAVDAVGETVSRTTLALLKPGDKVNLERALQPVSRLGGHFVQGHVDGIGEVVEMRRSDPGFWLLLRLSDELLSSLVEKGSIAIDGISLTVAKVAGDRISIAVIPHTAANTTIGGKKYGDWVNIETDILGKYVWQFLQRQRRTGDISQQKLEEWGY